MSQSKALLVLLLFVCCCVNSVLGSDGVSKKSSDSKVEYAKSAHVRIVSSDEESNGVFISRDGLIITAAHGVQWTPLKVFIYDGSALDVEVLYRDTLIDFALLRVRSEGSFPYLPIAEAPAVGDSILTIGRVKGEYEHTIGHGKIRMKGVNIFKDDLLWAKKSSRIHIDNGIIHSAPCEKGYSGGPVITKNGTLIGINCAYGKVKNQYFTFTVQMETIQGHLGQLVNDEGYSVYSSDKNSAYTRDVVKDVPARVDWVLQGLKRHSLSSGKDISHIEKIRDKIKKEALSKYEEGVLKEKNVTRYVWARYLKSM